jgi:hypothetical protein
MTDDEVLDHARADVEHPQRLGWGRFSARRQG